MTNEERQKQGGLVVERHILQNINQTVEQAMEESPELLYESKNYYPVDENGAGDEENGEYPEIYEFWSVSEWLSEKLEERGEVILYL